MSSNLIFATGGIITDLDGTAVHEDRGRIYIPEPVQLGLKKVYELGRPLVINSLRFPLSVIRTFGRDWYTMSNIQFKCILLLMREGGLRIGGTLVTTHRVSSQWILGASASRPG